MRKHEVKCCIEGDKSNTDLQNNINTFTVLYIQKVIQKSALPKAEQLKIVDELLKELNRTVSTKGGKPIYANCHLQQKIQMDR